MLGVVLFFSLVALVIPGAIAMHYVLVIKGKHGRYEYRRVV